MPTNENQLKPKKVEESNYEAVLFDLDGTLIDTAPDFISSLNLLLAEENKAPLADDIIRKTVSHGARALVTLAFGLNEEDERFGVLRDRLLTIYADNLSVKSRLFPGGDKLIATLEEKQLPWGIVTNKPSLYAIPLIRDLGLKCSSLICPDHVSHPKPHPEPLYLAASELQVKSDKCLYVGDHLRDIESGRNAGMQTVAALYGYIEDNEDPSSWKADFSINSILEILPLLFPSLSK